MLDSIHASKGFNLIELVVAMSIAAIVMAFAVPSFQDLVSRNRLTAVNNDLVTALALARRYAITHAKDVYLCELVSAQHCNDEHPFNANWSKGWMVFVDNNRNAQLDDDDKIVYVSYHPNRPKQSQVAIVFNQRGRLRFRPDGSARSAGFYLCTPTHHKHIYLLYSGRTRHNDDLTPKQIKRCHEKLFS